MTTQKTITIPLINQRPIRIMADRWLIIASAEEWNGQERCQANREHTLIVREESNDLNADVCGRILVHGSYETQWANEHQRKAGLLLDAFMVLGDDYWPAIIRAIREVGTEIGMTERGIKECIADLPPRDIDEGEPTQDNNEGVTK